MARLRPAPGTRSSFTSAFAFGVASFGLNATLSLASAIITARLYGVEVIGEYALAYAPTGALWYISTISEQPALVRRLAVLAPRDPRVSALTAAVFTLSQSLTVAVALLAAAICWPLFHGPLDQPDLYAPAMAVLAGYVLLANPGWNLDSVFAAFRAGRAMLFVRTGQAASFLVAAVLLTARTSTVWGLVAALLISYATGFLHRLVAVRAYTTLLPARADLRWAFGSLREMVGFGLRMTPGKVAFGLSQESGTWILGAAAGVATVGVWNRAQTLTSRLFDVIGRIRDVLLPTLVERHGAGDWPGFDRAMTDSMRYMGVLLLLPAAAVGGAAGGVMHLLFGAGFGAGGPTLAVLLVVLPLTGIGSLQSQALLALGHPTVVSNVQIAGMVATVAVGAALTVPLEGVGMALGFLAGRVTELTMQSIYVRRRVLGGRPSGWDRRLTLALGLTYAAGFAASRVVDDVVPGFLGVALAIISGTAVFAGALVALRVVVERDRARLRSVLRSETGRRLSARIPGLAHR